MSANPSPSDTVVVRDVEPSDLARILEINQANTPETLLPSQLHQRL